MCISRPKGSPGGRFVPISYAVSTVGDILWTNSPAFGRCRSVLGTSTAPSVDDATVDELPVGIHRDRPHGLHTWSPAGSAPIGHEPRPIPSSHSTYDYYEISRSWNYYRSSTGPGVDRGLTEVVVPL